MKYAIINHKKYAVDHVFNMVGNWTFTDKKGVIHLVDGEDVTAFGGGYQCEYEFDGEDTDGTKWYLCTTHDELAPSEDEPCSKWVNDPKITVDTAIAYAKWRVENQEDGIFWWERKYYVPEVGYVYNDFIERYL